MKALSGAHLRRPAITTALLLAGGAALAACGGGGGGSASSSQNSTQPSASPASKMSDALSSLGSSPYLQSSLTASLAGAAIPARTKQILSVLSYTLDESTAGTDLSKLHSPTAASFDFTVFVKGTALAEVRVLNHGAWYFHIDISQAQKIPGVTIPASALGTIQLIAGQGWLELTPSEISQIEGAVEKLPSAKKEMPQISKASTYLSLSKQIQAALHAYFDKTAKSTTGGVEVSGPLEAIVKTVTPYALQIEKVATGTTSPPTSKVSGTYQAVFGLTGPSMTSAAITVVVPDNGTSGPNDTFVLKASIAHAATPVAAPAHAEVIPESLIQQIGSAIGSSGGS